MLYVPDASISKLLVNPRAVASPSDVHGCFEVAKLAYRRTAERSRIAPSQAAVFDEVERLVRILQVRSNRDKLEDHQFFLAGSLLERWKWNSRIIRDDDLRDFLTKARELVTEIEAAERKIDQRNANA